MRRRLDVAAALVGRPPVLFLDEPTTGLDLPSRNALWGTIRDLVAEGTTVLLTTQYLEEADQLAKQIAVVDVGRVIAAGTPSELKAELGSTVIEFVMAGELDAQRAASVLSTPGGGSEVEGSTIRVPSGEGPRALMEMLRNLDAQGLYPMSLTVREPSLDDVFLRLTGHHAEPTPELELAEPVPVGGGA
jgi:ABC-type multidrug transport system ATPase subunit